MHKTLYSFLKPGNCSPYSIWLLTKCVRGFILTYFELQKMTQRAIKSSPQVKLFAFYDAIIVYHYLSENPKIGMETVN